MTINIGNIRDYIGTDGKVVLPDESYVYCGRGSKRHQLEDSPLGNPYKVIWGITREEIISSYRMWFYWRLSLPNENCLVKTELKRLLDLLKKHGTITLLCWCHPKLCHCSVIKEYLEAIK